MCMIDEKLTKAMIVEEFNVHINTVDNWIERGLPILKIGRLVRIKRSDLEEFIKSGKA